MASLCTKTTNRKPIRRNSKTQESEIKKFNKVKMFWDISYSFVNNINISEESVAASGLKMEPECSSKKFSIHFKKD
jgi:hypothetical protein